MGSGEWSVRCPRPGAGLRRTAIHGPVDHRERSPRDSIGDARGKAGHRACRWVPAATERPNRRSAKLIAWIVLDLRKVMALNIAQERADAHRIELPRCNRVPKTQNDPRTAALAQLENEGWRHRGISRRNSERSTAPSRDADYRDRTGRLVRRTGLSRQIGSPVRRSPRRIAIGARPRPGQRGMWHVSGHGSREAFEDYLRHASEPSDLELGKDVTIAVADAA